MTSDGRLDGKVAVVTGASQGIGRAICIEYARQGARVIAGARTELNLNETVRQGAGRIIAQTCDVRRAEDIKGLIDAATSRFGALDIMVNNAGILLTASLVETTDKVWDETMTTNVKATFLGMKFAIPAIAASGGGSIINMGSINSFTGEKGSAAYVASKGAVLMLTKAGAAECAAHNIRVNAICPAATDTPMIGEFFELHGSREQAEKWTASYQPLGGIIPPEQIAQAAVFLASDESARMTGTSMLIDGGLLSHWDHI